jgi:hypothetical protein
MDGFRRLATRLLQFDIGLPSCDGFVYKQPPFIQHNLKLSYSLEDVLKYENVRGNLRLQ